MDLTALTALTDKVRRLKAIDGISFRNWAKHYNALPDKPEAEDRPAKIARVLLSGETIEIVDFYAGGATFQEPEDVDPYDGTVYYSINANNIDEFINHYDKPVREPTASAVGSMSKSIERDAALENKSLPDGDET